MNYYDIKICEKEIFAKQITWKLRTFIVFRKIEEKELTLYISVCKKILLELNKKFDNNYILIIE